jgi:hypothetical protein
MSSSAEQYPPGYLEQNSQSTIWTVGSVFLVFDTCAIGLRLIARRTNGMKWGWDDLSAVVGYVLCAAIIGCSFGKLQGQELALVCKNDE